jgi:hypothetical protein
VARDRHYYYDPQRWVVYDFGMTHDTWWPL